MVILTLTVVTLLFMILAYNIFQKDIMSPSFLIFSGYFISFLSTAYNVDTWGMDIKVWTACIFILSMVSILSGEYFAKHRYSAQSWNVVKDDVYYIQIGNIKYLISIVVGIAILYLTFQEVVRIANLNLASWGNLIYNYKTNSVDTSLEDASLRSYVTQLNKLNRGLAYVYLVIFINNMFALKGKGKRENVKNARFLLPGIIYIAQSMVKGGRFEAIGFIIAATFLIYFYWRKCVGWHHEIKLKYIIRVVGVIVLIVFVFWASKELLGRQSKDTSIVGYITRYLGGSAADFDLLISDRSVVNDGHHETFANLVRNLNSSGITEIEVTSSHEFRNSPSGVVIGNAYSAIRNYYHDFGALGVIIFSFLFSYIFGTMYYKLKKYTEINNRNIFRVIFYSSLLYCTFFYFFTDYFFPRFLSVGWIVEQLLLWIAYYCVIRLKIRFGRIVL